MLSSGCASGVTHTMAGRPSHGQIIANIENNPLHYERDWQLDDSSQSSFRPCPQGSGSMTPMPFHDSLHNMNEIAPRRSFSNSTSGSVTDINQLPNQSTNTSPPSTATQPQMSLRSAASSAGQNKTNDLNLFKVHTNPTAPNSALFLENSDILNDAQYSKLYHRHSTVFVAPSAVELGSSIEDKSDSIASRIDHRRYSDTKLLHQRPAGFSRDIQPSADRTLPIFNVTSVLGVSIPPPTAVGPEPSTEIIFETVDQTTFDPLELNIQEMLELDVYRQSHPTTPAAASNSRKGRLSLHNVSVTDGAAGEPRAGPSNNAPRNFFKSLPNLSASSENLLEK